ncbi:MAG: esterase family protein [Lentisphaeria bacterium]|nr:esterase family protein [Lentisphaeria bacterium]
MALMQCSFFSESLGMCTSANVIVPQPTLGQIGLEGKGSPVGCPVLYLLHGLSDDHSIWLRRTSIERYATAFGIAVVMPNGYRSFYTDQVKTDIKYWQYISDELPKLINGFFKFSQKREDTFVAGLSMGGYGAMKLAFNKPETFAAAGCFSSVVRPWQFVDVAPAMKAELQCLFGDDPAANVGTLNDPLAMSEKQVKAGVPLTEVYQACGTEDFLYEHNRRFRLAAEEAGYGHCYGKGPGEHAWPYWDRAIQTALRFFLVLETDGEFY